MRARRQELKHDRRETDRGEKQKVYMDDYLQLFPDSCRILPWESCRKKTESGIPVLGRCMLSNLGMVCTCIVHGNHFVKGLC